MLVGANNMNYFKSTSKVHYIITYKGGKSGVAGVFQDKLFPFMHFFFNPISQFLSNSFSGLEYRTFNVYISGISTYHEKVEEICIGQNPTQTKFKH